jgi:hypothetical protein
VNYVDRPAFREGQLLTAADLQLAVDYPRDELETHVSVAHTFGVVDGMAFDFVPPVAPATTGAVVVAPGLAVDGLGRQITIAAAMTIVPDPLAGKAAGPYPAYVWYTEAPIASTAATMNPCAVAVGDRVRENANVGVFASDVAARAQFPNAVCLGYLGWNGTAFVPYTGPAASVRQGGGVRAHEIVAPEHAVLVHGEDRAPTTVSVQGALQAVASGDGTAPSLGAPGGTLVFSPAAGAPATSSIALSYAAASATGNGLIVNLGNNDPTSEVTIESQAGTMLAKVDGSGTVTATAGSFATVAASTSIAVTTGPSKLTLGATQPQNIAGVTASDTLALAFGQSDGDATMFIAGSAPVATIDANALTMTAKNLKLGILDTASGAAGLAAGNTDDLELRTASGDLAFNPGTQAVPPFRLTAGARLINAARGTPADVTPWTSTNAQGSVLQLGTLAIAFGSMSVTLNPLSQTPAAITFPLTFAAAPAFFVSVFSGSSHTISAVATAVSATSASYRVQRLKPNSPSDGDTATWSNTSLKVIVSWIALGASS